MRVPYHLNSKTYDVAPCPKCGGTEIDFDAGMLAGAITCRHCKYRVVHNDIFDALRKWGCEGLPLTKDEEIKQLREALREIRDTAGLRGYMYTEIARRALEADDEV